MKRSRAPWTKGEKAILTSIIVVVAIVLAAIGWNAYENADPIVHIPKVSMPAPNGFDYARSASEGIVQQWPMPGCVCRILGTARWQHFVTCNNKDCSVRSASALKIFRFFRN